MTADSGSTLDLAMVPAAVPVDAVIVTPGYVGVMQPGIAGGQTLIPTLKQRLPGRPPSGQTLNFGE